MSSTKNRPRPSGPSDACARPSAQNCTAAIVENSPFRWRATLNEESLDGEFTSVDEAFTAIVRAMRDRYGLIPAPGAADAPVEVSEGGEG
jgi:hypothetical protein